MDSLVQVNLHISQELQWSRGGRGLISSSESSFQRGITIVLGVDMDWTWLLKVRSALWKQGFSEFMVVSSSQTRFRKGAKSASGAPGQKSTPRGSKSATFAQWFFRLFNPQKIDTNPIGEPSVLPFQYPIYLWLQASAWKVIEIGGWCVPEYRFRNLWFKHTGI